MPSEQNYLLGQGESYSDYVTIKKGGGKKKPVYTFAQAKKRLTPMVETAVKQIVLLPDEACPNDEAVAIATLHHEFLSKTSYPNKLIEASGLRAIGSRPVFNTPEKVSKKSPAPQTTSELFLAGPRKSFAKMANDLKALTESDEIAGDIAKIENFRAPTPAERVQPMRSNEKRPLLEVVLHSGEGNAREALINKFQKYLGVLGLDISVDDRIDAGNLTFISMRAPTSKLNEIARFSFLRRVREMPRLRQLRPKVSTIRAERRQFDLSLPSGNVLDPTIRVAVFDGGLPDIPRLARYVDRYDEDVVDEVEEYESHGLAVTSAVLFGSLERGTSPATPYAKVDHYRVLDSDTDNDPQHELYPVLRRIIAALERESYDFINLSIGPDLPLDDDDVHPWTAKLDPLLSDGKTFATMAVGNSGEADAKAKLNKIQPPSDCVNAVSVGACDSEGPIWERASYSSIGHGRCPGLMKPDGVAFGGVESDPFWVIDYDDYGVAAPIMGTSLASPYVLRASIGVRAILGPSIGALANKALLIHNCQRTKKHRIHEVGWGRIETNVDRLVTCATSTTCVIYQGTLTPRKYLRAQVPLPSGNLVGPIIISATICYASNTDPDHPIHYTRNGLEIVFRPNKDMIPANRQTPESWSFFGEKFGAPELSLRKDAQKWETVRHETLVVKDKDLLLLKAPVFDIHCHPREAGHEAGKLLKDVPYGMVVSMQAPSMPNAYDDIIGKYPKLRPLVPRIQTRIQT